MRLKIIELEKRRNTTFTRGLSFVLRCNLHVRIVVSCDWSSAFADIGMYFCV